MGEKVLESYMNCFIIKRTDISCKLQNVQIYTITFQLNFIDSLGPRELMAAPPSDIFRQNTRSTCRFYCSLVVQLWPLNFEPLDQYKVLKIALCKTVVVAKRRAVAIILLFLHSLLGHNFKIHETRSGSH